MLHLLLPMVLVPAAAGDPVGISVTVRVLDASTGLPLATAAVHHVDESERHMVNKTSGEWTDSLLYLPNGEEFLFTKGLSLVFEASAPGYEQGLVQHKVHKKRNVVLVSLVPLPLETLEDPEKVQIGFKHDNPLD